MTTGSGVDWVRTGSAGQTCRCPCARQTRRLRRLVILGACVHGGRFRCSDVCRLVSLLVPPGFVCGVQHMHEVEGVGGSGDGL